MTALLAAARDRLAEKHREAVEERDRLEVAMERATEAYRLQAVRTATIADALAELDKALAEAEPEPMRQARMDIAQGVYANLGNGSGTIAELAKALDRKPGQIRAALRRLERDGKVDAVPGTLDTYRLRVREAAE